MSRPHVLPPLGAVLALLAAGLLAGPSARAEPTDELAEIRALRERGGHEASERLAELIRDGSEETRIAALRAVAAVGVRSRGLVRVVREVVDRRSPAALRSAVLEALGRIGGAEDVTPLIETLRGPDEALRGAAHRALQALTGRTTALDYGRWHRWWQVDDHKLVAGVRRALRLLPDARGREIERLRAVLARDGWTDLVYTTDAARDWLRARDRTLRTHGFYLAGVLRLGDAASDVGSALPYLTEVDGEDALLAARALGLPADLLAPYWRKRFEGGR